MPSESLRTRSTPCQSGVAYATARKPCGNLVNVAYLLLLGGFGIWLARRRMAGMLLT